MRCICIQTFISYSCRNAKERKHSASIFAFMFYSTNKCLVSDYVKFTMNYISVSSQTSAMSWHGTLKFLGCCPLYDFCKFTVYNHISPGSSAVSCETLASQLFCFVFFISLVFTAENWDQRELVVFGLCGNLVIKTITVLHTEAVSVNLWDGKLSEMSFQNLCPEVSMGVHAFTVVHSCSSHSSQKV